MEQITNKLISKALHFSNIKTSGRGLFAPAKLYFSSRSNCQEGRGNETQISNLKPLHTYNSPDEMCYDWLKEKGPLLDILGVMQVPQDIDFQRTKEVLDWWEQLKISEEKEDQAYDLKRVMEHGPDSAAAHFFIERQASIRLKDHDDWIVGGVPALTHCVAGYFIQDRLHNTNYFVEAIDCTNFYCGGIRYEGLRYLDGLKHLKWLSLKNQKHIDVYALDRIAGQNGNTLEYLDLTGCNIDFECTVAISKMPALKKLVLSKSTVKKEARQVFWILSKQRPNLNIEWVSLNQRPIRISPNHIPSPNKEKPPRNTETGQDGLKGILNTYRRKTTKQEDNIR